MNAIWRVVLLVPESVISYAIHRISLANLAWNLRNNFIAISCQQGRTLFSNKTKKSSGIFSCTESMPMKFLTFSCIWKIKLISAKTFFPSLRLKTQISIDENQFWWESNIEKYIFLLELFSILRVFQHANANIYLRQILIHQGKILIFYLYKRNEIEIFPSKNLKCRKVEKYSNRSKPFPVRELLGTILFEIFFTRKVIVWRPVCYFEVAAREISNSPIGFSFELLHLSWYAWKNDWFLLLI